MHRFTLEIVTLRIQCSEVTRISHRSNSRATKLTVNVPTHTRIHFVRSDPRKVLSLSAGPFLFLGGCFILAITPHSLRCLPANNTGAKLRSEVRESDYELDDPDQAEILELPVDLHLDVIGVLTPHQQFRFWSCVDSELQPMDLLDDLLRRLGMTPAEHNQADHFVMKSVLALQWWRAFPTITAGQSAIDSQPNLTTQVIDQINSMAMRCYVDGENYDLYTTLVH